MWSGTVLFLFLLSLDASSQFACPTLVDGQHCQGKFCLFASNQTKEGPVQWAGCDPPPQIFAFPVKKCIEAFGTNISNVCLQKDQIKFCCCQGDQCNAELIKGWRFDIQPLDVLWLLCGLLIVIVYSLFHWMISNAVKKCYKEQPNYLTPSIYRVFIALLSIQIFFTVVCFFLHIIPLPMTCSNPPNRLISVPMRPLFALTHSIGIAVLFWANVFYIYIKINQLIMLKQRNKYPLDALVDRVMLMVAIVLWIIWYALIYFHTKYIALTDGEYCTNELPLQILLGHNMIVQTVISIDCGICIFTEIRICLLRRRASKPEPLTNSIVEKTQSTMLATAHPPTMIQNELIIEPRPFCLSSKGEGVLAITNTTTSQWLTLRLLVSSPFHYRISPKYLLLPPQRKATIEFSMKVPTNASEQELFKDHIVMLEWFEIGTECPSCDAVTMWKRPHKVSRSKWSHHIFSIFHEPASISEIRNLSSHVSSAEKLSISTRA